MRVTMSLACTAVTAFSLAGAPSAYSNPNPNDGMLEPERAAEVGYNADRNFVVRLDGEINAASANGVRNRLYELAQKDPTQEIILEINSGGGSVPDGYNIIDAMNSIPNKVTTICQRAESMAAIILVSNQSGDRYAYPNCRLMLHEPSWQANGTASAVSQRAEDLRGTRTLFAQGISRASGLSIPQAMRLIATGDRVLNAAQAYQLNLIDGIIPAMTKHVRLARTPSLSALPCSVQDNDQCMGVGLAYQTGPGPTLGVR